MKADPIPRKSIPELVAGKLAAAILSEAYKTGEQLPSERDLIKEFEISRSSLREALTILSEAELIEVQPGVGWFVRPLDAGNLVRARQIAGDQATSRPAPNDKKPADQTPVGPRRLPVASEKPIRIPNLKTDRLGTFDFISWWERDKVKDARIMVVGAGALGNEVIKNLTLMGVGNLFIVDFDEVEAANLSRSILFRESDSGRQKSRLAAARAKEINPDVNVQYFHGDVTNALGLGVFRRMDAVIGCLDNREARLAVNRFTYWVNKPWVDGAIQELLGLVRVFIPGEGACFECTLTEQARRDLALRYSCPLLARQNILMGKVPTTPTIASIIGAMQSQEALKLIHNMDVEAGKVTHFNGLNNHMHTTAYAPDEDCESHWTYGEITELPLRAETNTMQDLMAIVKSELGPDAVVETDQELVISLSCSVCNTEEKVLKPMSAVSFEAAHCPTCGEMREVVMSHLITGEEDYLHHTLFNLGIPPLHIVRANNGDEYRFYELTGDLADSLHFSDFSEHERRPNMDGGSGRVRLGDAVADTPQKQAKTKTIRLLD